MRAPVPPTKAALSAAALHPAEASATVRATKATPGEPHRDRLLVGVDILDGMEEEPIVLEAKANLSLLMYREHKTQTQPMNMRKVSISWKAVIFGELLEQTKAQKVQASPKLEFNR